ncbi:tRNA pseudouridine(13) synthase TruD [Legionella geestiana]|uniref:tRNA pseudouridine(13) synthase TruD n=1 Tax=Legionella geestiana TaxID=45065 RepID=UPI001091AB75|nr:tRNA pseudouridine(13) synthase TruD [Legionella geestiana]QDQ40922.1 tRNA pseudouridine(13) synthase TruD [Legionella geestiana]
MTHPDFSNALNWLRAHGMPECEALIREVPEDFQVDEQFSGAFSGDGEHLILHIEKRGLTTEEVVKSLARIVNKPESCISYAGLKDRHALTTQFFSLHLPGEYVEGAEALSAPGWRVISATRHHKKLRPGALSGNRFLLRLREVSDTVALLEQLERVKQTGVPNYFGEQRFGREGGNLLKAHAMLAEGQKIRSRFHRGMYCSAARSWLFNEILAARVRAATWNKPLEGDVFQLAGSNSIFTVPILDATLHERILARDISPAGPLAGKGKVVASGEALSIITEVYHTWQTWVLALEKMGLQEAWRANILHPENLQCEVDGTTAELTFSLPAGAYATSVLRELVLYQTA